MSGPHIPLVMVVDDDDFDRMLSLRVVARSGLVGVALGFESGQAALAHLRDRRIDVPDLILLDIRMPKMNGFDFIEAATAEFGAGFAGAVVVMLTTSLDPSDQLRALRYPVVRDYLHKPLVEGHLARLARLVEGETAA